MEWWRHQKAVSCWFFFKVHMVAVHHKNFSRSEPDKPVTLHSNSRVNMKIKSKNINFWLKFFSLMLFWLKLPLKLCEVCKESKKLDFLTTGNFSQSEAKFSRFEGPKLLPPGIFVFLKSQIIIPESFILVAKFAEKWQNFALWSLTKRNCGKEKYYKNFKSNLIPNVKFCCVYVSVRLSVRCNHA